VLVETDGLSKRYGRVAALVECSLGVERGEILGLLGPNGAGKTTLLRLLLGYLKPTAGRAAVDGLDCYRRAIDVHRRLSYLPCTWCAIAARRPRQSARIIAH
jgi:ABC-2 type transport system ATP-binding protein